jgi:hypothetical protein
MTASETRPAADPQDENAHPTSTVSTNLDDLGSRAADLSADLYADLEHEQRKERFDRARERESL